MSKGKAFVVVGHAHWGKSATLKELTSGNRYQRWITIKNVNIYIKRMSNDDDPTSLLDFLRKINNSEKAGIIITFCPNFDEKSKKTVEILKLLESKYTPFFWVLKKNYAQTDEIKDAEIKELASFGKLEIFARHAEANIRAVALRQYIETHL